MGWGGDGGRAQDGRVIRVGGRDDVLGTQLPCHRGWDPLGRLASKILPRVPTSNGECTHSQGHPVLGMLGEFSLTEAQRAGQDRDHPSAFHRRGD